MDFYDRVKELVKQNNLSLISFLESLGISYESYKTTKRYNKLPRADEAIKIANALNTTVEFLVSGQSEQTDNIKTALKTELLKAIETIFN